ncbi:MAG: tetratricopeptide repeat protein [Patescibacteria group bacterium]|jgi:tetratricopeptide (TPR) repeat protein
MISQISSRFVRFYERIAKGLLFLMAFLVPLAYFPWTVDNLEVNKQTILIFGASILTIAWLGIMVLKKQFYFKKSFLFILAGLFLLAVGLSSILSLAPYLSVFGQGAQEYTSFLTLLGFVLLFIVGSHYLSETKTQSMLLGVSLLASAIIGTLIIIALLGFPLFNTNFIGTPNGLGLYLLVMSIIGSGLWLAENPLEERRILLTGWKGIVERIAIFVTVISSIVILLTLDYHVLWILSIFGIGAMFTFAFVRAREFPHTSRFVLPMVLFVVSIVFLFLPSFLYGKFAVEVSPSHSASFAIARETLSDTSWLFGSGPGTFMMDYSKYHSTDVNTTDFWDIRFDRAIANSYTMLATYGIVGMFFFLFFVGSLGAATLSSLIKQHVHDEWKMTFVAFSGWVVLVLSFFLYSSNFTLTFLFWMLSAFLVSQLGPQIKQWAFSESPRSGLFTSFLFVLVNVGLLTLLFVTASRYAAEIAFAHASSVDKNTTDTDLVISDLDTAARLNKYSDIYYRNLGNALLIKAAEEVADPNADVNVLRDILSTCITAAKRATELSPNNVVNWHVLGDIYREVVPLVGNADMYAVEAYKQAVALAPANPKYLVALARAYLVRADQLQTLMESDDETVADEASLAWDEAIKSAEESLDAAVRLKSDYAVAYYYLALTYERQGNLADAISRMESVRSTNLNDIGVAFQLSILYLRQGKIDEAQAELERALEISPNFSNALWYLSAIYEEQGDIEKAIEMIEKVKELNPGNSIVEERLNNLLGGMSNPTIPDPISENETEPIEVDVPSENL